MACVEKTVKFGLRLPSCLGCFPAIAPPNTIGKGCTCAGFAKGPAPKRLRYPLQGNLGGGFVKHAAPKKPRRKSLASPHKKRQETRPAAPTSRRRKLNGSSSHRAKAVHPRPQPHLIWRLSPPLRGYAWRCSTQTSRRHSANGMAAGRPSEENIQKRQYPSSHSSRDRSAIWKKLSTR